MKRVAEGVIEMTDEEAESIADFISSTLYRDWDSYTDLYFCPNIKWEDGMRRMDPKMFEMMNKIRSL